MYERLLDLVCEWRAGRLDLDGVLTRVTQLFADDPALALGFNIFLP